MTSKCGKNKKGAHEAQPSVSLMSTVSLGIYLLNIYMFYIYTHISTYNHKHSIIIIINGKYFDEGMHRSAYFYLGNIASIPLCFRMIVLTLWFTRTVMPLSFYILCEETKARAVKQERIVSDMTE